MPKEKENKNVTALERPSKEKNQARWTSGEVAGFSSQIGRVRIPHEPLLTSGIVADKVMHRSLKPGHVGSIPTDPTLIVASGPAKAALFRGAKGDD